MPAVQRTVSGSHGSARVTRKNETWKMKMKMNVVFLFEISKHFTRKQVRRPPAFISLIFLSALSWKRKFRAQISLFHVCILFQPLCISFL